MVEQHILDHNRNISDMNERFVKALHDTVVVDGLTSYNKMYESAVISDKFNQRDTDEISFYHSLNDNQKRILMLFLEDVMIDTVSHVLGIIDGSSSVNDYDIEPKLLLGSIDTESELQDSYLGYIEEFR